MRARQAIKENIVVLSSVIQAITVYGDTSRTPSSLSMFSASRMNLLRNFSGQHLVFAIAVLSIFVGYRCCCEAAFSEYEDIEFELHTRELPESYQRLNTSWGDHILGTQWKAGRPTRMFVHGFKSKRKTIDRYKNAFLASGDYNFIAVNWMKGSSTFNYYVAKNRVKKVSHMNIYLLLYAFCVINQLWIAQLMVLRRQLSEVLIEC